MAVTNAQANPKPEPRKAGKKLTTLDEDVDKPQVTEPGDAPFDTLDPNERATSTSPDKGAAAKAGFGSVNAVTILPPADSLVEEREGPDRTESYDAIGPNGKKVRVTRNIETGESTVA